MYDDYTGRRRWSFYSSWSYSYVSDAYTGRRRLSSYSSGSRCD